MPSEADTCRQFVVPKLQAAGWDTEPYSIADAKPPGYETRARWLDRDDLDAVSMPARTHAWSPKASHSSLRGKPFMRQRQMIAWILLGVAACAPEVVRRPTEFRRGSTPGPGRRRDFAS
jgi:hypothetical protein